MTQKLGAGEIGHVDMEYLEALVTKSKMQHINLGSCEHAISLLAPAVANRNIWLLEGRVRSSRIQHS